LNLKEILMQYQKLRNQLYMNLKETILQDLLQDLNQLLINKYKNCKVKIMNLLLIQLFKPPILFQYLINNLQIKIRINKLLQIT